MYKELNGKRYIEQWERVNRWYNKVHRIEAGEIDTSEPKILLDYMYTFFINCYHLKDWIEDTKPELKQKLTDLFAKNTGPEAMRMCYDITHGIKHFTLKSDRKRIMDNSQRTKSNSRPTNRQSSPRKKKSLL